MLFKGADMIELNWKRCHFN